MEQGQLQQHAGIASARSSTSTREETRRDSGDGGGRRPAVVLGTGNDNDGASEPSAMTSDCSGPSLSAHNKTGAKERPGAMAGIAAIARHRRLVSGLRSEPPCIVRACTSSPAWRTPIPRLASPAADTRAETCDASAVRGRTDKPEAGAPGGQKPGPSRQGM
jgi:hypothetical protein